MKKKIIAAFKRLIGESCFSHMTSLALYDENWTLVLRTEKLYL